MARPKFPSDHQDQFMLRLPNGMRDRIKVAAASNNRSMNAEIVASLEEKYPAPAVGENIEKYVRLYELHQNGEISQEEYQAGVPRFFRFFMSEFAEYEKHNPEPFAYDEDYESAWFEGRRTARHISGSKAENPYPEGSPTHDAWRRGFESASEPPPSKDR